MSAFLKRGLNSRGAIPYMASMMWYLSMPWKPFQSLRKLEWLGSEMMGSQGF